MKVHTYEKTKVGMLLQKKIIQLCSLVLKGLLTGLLVDLFGNLQPRPNIYVSSILSARSTTRPENFLIIGNVD
jgi:hypothetical protein